MKKIPLVYHNKANDQIDGSTFTEQSVINIGMGLPKEIVERLSKHSTSNIVKFNGVIVVQTQNILSYKQDCTVTTIFR